MPTLNRRNATIAFLVFLVSAFAAIVLAVQSATKNYDAALIRTTAEVRGVIQRIYEYRRATGKHPDSQVELRPIAGDEISKRVLTTVGGHRTWELFVVCLTLAYLVAVSTSRRQDSCPPVCRGGGARR
jgi:hypothetical protein